MFGLLFALGSHSNWPFSGLFFWQGWPSQVTDDSLLQEPAMELPIVGGALSQADGLNVLNSSSNSSFSGLVPLTILTSSNTTFLESTAQSEFFFEGIEVDDGGLAVLPEVTSCGNEVGVLNQIFLFLLRVLLHVELQPFRVYLKVETLFGTLAHVLLSTAGSRP
jgi:hypothetical protein